MIRVLCERHATPRDVVTTLLEAGGRNRFGEPLFRAVWSNARLAWIGGEFTEYDSHGNYLGTRVKIVEEPKYWHLPNRWIIERWCPPEMYGSPRAWPEQELGPYPARGDYECAFVVERDSRFMQITPAICRELVRRVRAGEGIPTWMHKTAIREQIERNERRKRNERLDMLSDVSPFNKGSYVTVPRDIGG